MELEAFIVEGADSIIESQRSPERTPNVFSVRRSRTGKWDGYPHLGEANETNKQSKTSQELRMLSSVTLNCQVTKIVKDSGYELSEL